MCMCSVESAVVEADVLSTHFALSLLVVEHACTGQEPQPWPPAMLQLTKKLNSCPVKIESLCGNTFKACCDQ